MTKNKLRQKLKFLTFIFSLFFPLSIVSASTVLSTHKYAWSNNVGYINFENVVVGDNTLSGHAWSTNSGWINFSPAQGGVINDGAGNLSGAAWGEQLGYIDFNNVLINSTTGKFSGTATGTSVGTITFDCPSFCDVETDWRGATVIIPPIGPSGGGGSAENVQQENLISTPIPTTVPAVSIQESTESIQAKLVDIQKDGIINILDFNAMMVNWGSNQNLGSVGSAFNLVADMNSDGVVDIFDFNTLMVYWGITYQV